MRRRTLILSLGSGALLAGLATSLWRERCAVADAGRVAAAAVKDSARQVLQSAALTDLHGAAATLPVGERRFLLNFWATWCPPCLHEIPLLDAAHDAQALPVVGLAVDELPAVMDFAREHPFGYPAVVAGLNNGITLLERLGNPSAAMPYSVVVELSGMLGPSKTGPFASADEVVRLFGGTPG